MQRLSGALIAVNTSQGRTPKTMLRSPACLLQCTFNWLHFKCLAPVVQQLSPAKSISCRLHVLARARQLAVKHTGCNTPSVACCACCVAARLVKCWCFMLGQLGIQQTAACGAACTMLNRARHAHCFTPECDKTFRCR